MEGIFISHSTKDATAACRLTIALKQNGYEVWIARDDVKPGDMILPRISDALEKCEVFLLLWSNNAKESISVTQEWAAAALNRKKIIPLLLDETSLPFILQGYRYIDFGDFDCGLSELLKALISTMDEPQPTFSKHL